MAKVAVISQPALAAGFALVGVDAYPVTSAAEAKKLLTALMRESDVGIVAVDAGYFAAFDEVTRRSARESHRPVIVALPSGVPTAAGERPSEQIAEIIRRAIGFRISFKEG